MKVKYEICQEKLIETPEIDHNIENTDEDKEIQTLENMQDDNVKTLENRQFEKGIIGV